MWKQPCTDTQEPLDGIFGFSQGANMASLLAAQATAGAGAEDPLLELQYL